MYGHDSTTLYIIVYNGDAESRRLTNTLQPSANVNIRGPGQFCPRQLARAHPLTGRQGYSPIIVRGGAGKGWLGVSSICRRWTTSSYTVPGPAHAPTLSRSLASAAAVRFCNRYKHGYTQYTAALRLPRFGGGRRDGRRRLCRISVASQFA